MDLKVRMLLGKVKEREVMYLRQLELCKKYLYDYDISFDNMEKETLKYLLYTMNMSEGIIADALEVEQKDIVKLCIQWNLYR
ncbi:hypothetical protein PT241_05865 [Erysipelothrix rhusiopathiae]|uniref:hypothetical protein n=1 Tax=Erysipelothrix rhusiopathiae TaxID=1648 RepID=UPI001EDF40E9|nr:hypothetical protein [Erysipelothrix rhusiopathiae]MCG4457703.1 hypothetical protein [Erysipelothrix rhusiopathiae]MDE8061331.1 hypothetical protein [Erysipelothrix rhusiopathiae]MDE8220855.1 hypothetical protein [Erysipelothrix rhusiopathiae]MDE8338263.1 hypothetical protein [Erysipelothrix rhusiopathiae]